MLASLENQVVFKQAFTNKLVFEQLIKDFFDIEIKVGKIETEKKFRIKTSLIDITLDIYAETQDRRFVIELQKIQYDHNFDRFFNYFVSLIIQQQRSYKEYNIKKTVIGIIILTRPYRFKKLTGEPILENYMTLDFNPRDINDKKIQINEHELKFVNTCNKYTSDNKLPAAIQDWINLFQHTIYEDQTIKINFGNKAIKKVTNLIKTDNIDSDTLERIRQEAGRKQVLALEYQAGIDEEKERNKKLIKQAEAREKQAVEEKKKAEAREKQAGKKNQQIVKIFSLYYSKQKSVDEISKLLNISIVDINTILQN